MPDPMPWDQYEVSSLEEKRGPELPSVVAKEPIAGKLLPPLTYTLDGLLAKIEKNDSFPAGITVLPASLQDAEVWVQQIRAEQESKAESKRSFPTLLNRIKEITDQFLKKIQDDITADFDKVIPDSSQPKLVLRHDDDGRPFYEVVIEYTFVGNKSKDEQDSKQEGEQEARAYRAFLAIKIKPVTVNGKLEPYIEANFYLNEQLQYAFQEKVIAARNILNQRVLEARSKGTENYKIPSEPGFGASIRFSETSPEFSVASAGDSLLFDVTAILNLVRNLPLPSQLSQGTSARDFSKRKDVKGFVASAPFQKFVTQLTALIPVAGPKIWGQYAYKAFGGDAVFSSLVQAFLRHGTTVEDKEKLRKVVNFIIGSEAHGPHYSLAVLSGCVETIAAQGYLLKTLESKPENQVIPRPEIYLDIDDTLVNEEGEFNQELLEFLKTKRISKVCLLTQRCIAAMAYITDSNSLDRIEKVKNWLLENGILVVDVVTSMDPEHDLTDPSSSYYEEKLLPSIDIFKRRFAGKETKSDTQWINGEVTKELSKKNNRKLKAYQFAVEKHGKEIPVIDDSPDQYVDNELKRDAGVRPYVVESHPKKNRDQYRVEFNGALCLPVLREYNQSYFACLNQTSVKDNVFDKIGMILGRSHDEQINFHHGYINFLINQISLGVQNNLTEYEKSTILVNALHWLVYAISRKTFLADPRLLAVCNNLLKQCSKYVVAEVDQMLFGDVQKSLDLKVTPPAELDYIRINQLVLLQTEDQIKIELVKGDLKYLLYLIRSRSYPCIKLNSLYKVFYQKFKDELTDKEKAVLVHEFLKAKDYAREMYAVNDYIAAKRSKGLEVDCSKSLKEKRVDEFVVVQHLVNANYGKLYARDNISGLDMASKFLKVHSNDCLKFTGDFRDDFSTLKVACKTKHNDAVKTVKDYLKEHYANLSSRQQRKIIELIYKYLPKEKDQIFDVVVGIKVDKSTWWSRTKQLWASFGIENALVLPAILAPFLAISKSATSSVTAAISTGSSQEERVEDLCFGELEQVNGSAQKITKGLSLTPESVSEDDCNKALAMCDGKFTETASTVDVSTPPHHFDNDDESSHSSLPGAVVSSAASTDADTSDSDDERPKHAPESLPQVPVRTSGGPAVCAFSAAPG